MTDDLVERVARAIEKEFASSGVNPHDWHMEAAAAIRVVVEECARECERRAREYSDDDHCWDMAFDIVAADIRALAKEGRE